MNVIPYFHVWTATHVLQFSSETISFNFVWLSRNVLSLTIDLLPVSFYFIHYSYFVWTATPFRLFCWVELSHFSLYECHTCASSLCECHTIILVSITFTWTLRFVSLWVITDPFSFLPCVDCHTSFLKWKIHLFYLFFFLFGNITNLFITTFTFPMQ